MSKVKTVVGRVADFTPGSGTSVEVNGRTIAVFNSGGEFFAVANRCPHEGAPLCRGLLVGMVESDEPGTYRVSRRGEIVRCPWHGWEFDLRTGQSRCDPRRLRVKPFPIKVEPGQTLVEGPYRIDTFPISVEDDYLIIET